MRLRKDCNVQFAAKIHLGNGPNGLTIDIDKLLKTVFDSWMMEYKMSRKSLFSILHILNREIVCRCGVAVLEPTHLVTYYVLILVPYHSNIQVTVFYVIMNIFLVPNMEKYYSRMYLSNFYYNHYILEF